MAETEVTPTPVVATDEECVKVTDEVLSATTSDGLTRVIVNLGFCKGCEICVEVCPKSVLRMVVAMDRWEGATVEIVDIDACTACMLCENQCPDFAIEVYTEKKKKKEAEAVARNKTYGKEGCVLAGQRSDCGGRLGGRLPILRRLPYHAFL